MRRTPSSRSSNRSLTDKLAELHELDLAALKQRWRALYRNEAPVRIGQALLLHAVACARTATRSREGFRATLHKREIR